MAEPDKLTEALATPVTLDDLWGRLSDKSAQKLHDAIERLRGEWEDDISLQQE